MREKFVYVWGLSEDEKITLSLAAGSAGTRLQCPEFTIVELAEGSLEPQDFVVRAKNASDIVAIERLSVEWSQHRYAIIVDYEDRALVSMALRSRGVIPILRPLRSDEAALSLALLQDSNRDRGNQERVFGSASTTELRLKWATGKLPITRTARFLSGLLVSLGFFELRLGEQVASIAIEEALVNAVEHGNLCLDSALKPGNLVGPDRYESLKAKRLADPAYTNKSVIVGLVADEERARISISDEGVGFDPETLSPKAESLVSDISGNGFMLMRRAFALSYDRDKKTLVMEKARG